jgi:hypothetical protein
VSVPDVVNTPPPLTAPSLDPGLSLPAVTLPDIPVTVPNIQVTLPPLPSLPPLLPKLP